MKKSVFALAALACAGAACAQSSVTIFGVLDATLQHGSGSIANKTQLTNSGLTSSQLGLRGTEDLGGGKSASFWIEAGVNNDDGSAQATNTNNQASGVTTPGGLVFNRRSTVSLSADWGELRLGRDYTPQFSNQAAFDPWGAVGIGANQVLVGQIGLYPAGMGTTGPVARASNTVGYWLPDGLGGLYGRAQVYLGENSAGSSSKNGQGAGVRLGYMKDAWNLAFAMATTKYSTGDVRQTNVAASYDFGLLKLMGNYSRDRLDSPVPVQGRGGLLGAVVPVGVAQLRASFASYRYDTPGAPGTKKLSVGYIYNLSKRSALYVSAARVTNSGGAAVALGGASTAPNAASTGFDVGLKHSF